MARADSVLEHVRSLDTRAESLYQQAIEILQEARAAKDPHVAVKAIREATGVLRQLQSGAELRAKLSGELQAVRDRTHGSGPSRGPHVAMIFVPQWVGPAPKPVRLPPQGSQALPAPADTEEGR